jgi:hemerythrin-like domain-containing protein
MAMPADFDEAEKIELIALLAEAIAQEHQAASPRAATLQAILDKLENEQDGSSELEAARDPRIHSFAQRWKREVAIEDRVIQPAVASAGELAARRKTASAVILAAAAVFLAAMFYFGKL